MSEPESLSTDESLDVHVRRHSYDRLLMISDGIFAIAITLAALEIKLPEAGGTAAEIAHAMLRPIIAYLVSFAMIAIFWLHHRDLFARVRRVDAVLTALTLLLLCLISLIPVMVHGIYAAGEEDSAFALYAVTMIACGLTNTAMWGYAAARPGVLRDEVSGRFRIARLAMALVLPLVFVPVLFVPMDQLAQWMLPIAIGVAVLRRVVLPRWLKAAG